MRYLLDTHTWIWWNVLPDELSPDVYKIISNPKGNEEFLLSVISVWEFSKIIQKRRMIISSTPEDWIEKALAMPNLRVAPFTPRIAYRSTVLPGQFHQDPADQIIVATAREEGAVILTKDERIRAYPHVRSIW